MKKLVMFVVTVALATGVIGSTSCYAGDEGWAAAGGFLGGLVIGSAASSSYHHGGTVYHSGYDTYPVYYNSGHRYYYPRRYRSHYRHSVSCSCCNGYWY